jgi:hypothetical protein
MSIFLPTNVCIESRTLHNLKRELLNILKLLMRGRSSKTIFHMGVFVSILIAYRAVSGYVAPVERGCLEEEEPRSSILFVVLACNAASRTFLGLCTIEGVAVDELDPEPGGVTCYIVVTAPRQIIRTLIASAPPWLVKVEKPPENWKREARFRRQQQALYANMRTVKT